MILNIVLIFSYMVNTISFRLTNCFQLKKPRQFRVLRSDVRNEVKLIVETLIDVELGIIKNLSAQNILLENAHLLTKLKYYEQSVDCILNECADNKKIAALMNFNDQVKEFIIAERKSRCRDKLKYLVIGASIGRLESAIDNLSCR